VTINYTIRKTEVPDGECCGEKNSTAGFGEALNKIEKGKFRTTSTNRD